MFAQKLYPGTAELFPKWLYVGFFDKKPLEMKDNFKTFNIKIMVALTTPSHIWESLRLLPAAAGWVFSSVEEEQSRPAM